MKKRMTQMIAFVLLLCISIVPISAASAVDIYIDTAGITNYNKCGYGDRAGTQYCDKLLGGLREAFLGTSTWIGYSNYLWNDDCNRDSVINLSKNRATLFVYAGHGISFDSNNNNALHVNKNSGNKYHNTLGEKSSTQINVRTTDLANTKHQYMIAYTCNFLTNSGSQTKLDNMYKMGARVLCGFASIMWLDSREGYYSGKLMKTDSVKSAFIKGTWRYQVGRKVGTTSIARVQGLKSATSEKVTANMGLAPSYANNKSLYSVLQTEYTSGGDKPK